MVVPTPVVPRVVMVSEVVQITALVVTGRDSFASVILFNVVGDIVVADSSETVAVMDPDRSGPGPGGRRVPQATREAGADGGHPHPWGGGRGPGARGGERWQAAFLTV